MKARGLAAASPAPHAGRSACLPWYDLLELRAPTDRLWQRVAGELGRAGVGSVPGALDRTLHYQDQWDSGALLLGQACGYDVALAHAHKLQLVSTPCYALNGCEGPTYRSFVVVRDRDPARSVADLRGYRCVINTPTSHSGMNVLRSLVAPLADDGRFFGSAVVSGAHEISLAMLRAGTADVAAIDCVTYGLLERVRPELLANTRIIHRTVAVPAPPYVTSSSTPGEVVARLRDALRAAIADPEIASPLCITGTVELTIEDYQPIVELERLADQHQYTELTSLVS